MSKRNLINLITDSKFLQLKSLLDALYLYRWMHTQVMCCSVKKMAELSDDDEDNAEHEMMNFTPKLQNKYLPKAIVDTNTVQCINKMNDNIAFPFRI
jgi:hypothetical protein